MSDDTPIERRLVNPRGRRQYSSARIRAMLEVLIEDPERLSLEQRRRLGGALVHALDWTDDDPRYAELVLGTREIAAYVDGQPGSETR